MLARAVLTVEAAVTTIDVARGFAEHLWVVRNSCVQETVSRKVFVPRPVRVSRHLKSAAGLLNRDLATSGQPGTHDGHLWFWAMHSWHSRKDVRLETFNGSYSYRKVQTKSARQQATHWNAGVHWRSDLLCVGQVPLARGNSYSRGKMGVNNGLGNGEKSFCKCRVWRMRRLQTI